jgi:hypothetical protein
MSNSTSETTLFSDGHLLGDFPSAIERERIKGHVKNNVPIALPVEIDAGNLVCLGPVNIRTIRSPEVGIRRSPDVHCAARRHSDYFRRTAAAKMNEAIKLHTDGRWRDCRCESTKYYGGSKRGGG